MRFISVLFRARCSLSLGEKARFEILDQPLSGGSRRLSAQMHGMNRNPLKRYAWIGQG
jgi:hypothetical protein